MNELALFAGAGGGLLASQWLKGWRTVCYVEWAKYPARVIEARIRDGFLDDAPIWDDVATFDGRPWRGIVDIVTGGFPCQPFSTAGKRKSSDDLRNGWPHTIRIIREVQPRFVFLENVRGLLSAVDKAADEPVPYFGTILRDLASSGYDASWRVLSAAELGAPHKRDRVWIAAHCNGSKWWTQTQVGESDHERKYALPEKREQSAARFRNVCQVVANANGRCSQRKEDEICPGWELAELCGEDVADATCRGCEGRRLPVRPGGPQEGQTDANRRGADVAYAQGIRQREQADKADAITIGGKAWPESCCGSEQMGHPISQGLAEWEGQRRDTQEEQPTTVGANWQGGEWWAIEPGLGRVADGVAHRVDRLKAIGNGQVPDVAGKAWDLLTGNEQ